MEEVKSVVQKIEDVVDKVVSEFEKKPITTTLKGVILLWVIKEVVKWFKK